MAAANPFPLWEVCVNATSSFDRLRTRKIAPAPIYAKVRVAGEGFRVRGASDALRKSRWNRPDTTSPRLRAAAPAAQACVAPERTEMTGWR